MTVYAAPAFVAEWLFRRIIMADWPANGTTDWNTVMKANIDVGHDSDGTHKKSQMLTDMEWSPTTYGGGETTTFPNGLIIKMGYKACGGANTTSTITFGTAFPTGVVSVTLGPRFTGATGIDWAPWVGAPIAASFTIRWGTAITGAYWTAIGY